MNFYFYLTVLIVLDLCTALFARYAFNNSSTLFLVLAMASLTLAGWIFMKMLKYNLTVVVNAIWISLGTIFVTIGSYLVFDETISLMQGVGIAIIISGMIIIECSPAKKEKISEFIESDSSDI